MDGGHRPLGAPGSTCLPVPDFRLLPPALGRIDFHGKPLVCGTWEALGNEHMGYRP